MGADDATQVAEPRERPCSNANFLVDFGGADPRSVAAGFSEVIFPPFMVDAPAVPPAAASIDNCLILKRGVTSTSICMPGGRRRGAARRRSGAR